MPEPTTMNWDTFFKVWAVLGPLLAAAASALWSRHTHVGDREYEHSRELERLNQADATRNRDHLRSVRVERYNATKDALADFMASSQEYVRKQSDYWTDPVPNKFQAASQANDKFAYSSQVVTLLGDEPLAASALVLWNTALAIPKSYNTPSDPQYEQKLVAYRAARSEFNEHARRYLRLLDIQDV